MSTLLIYGATGYTGRMAAERAKALGLNIEIAGRNQQRLAALAAQLVGARRSDAYAIALRATKGVPPDAANDSAE